MAEEKKDDAAKTEESKEDKSSTAKATADKKDVEVPAKFKSLVEEIEKMSVMDLAELVGILEDKFGVSAAAPAMMMAGAMPGAANGEEVEEKTEFDVELSETGANKIAVIKAIRAITDMGLKDAKDLVDAAPKVIKKRVKKEEADEAKKQLEEAGAKVTLK